MNGPSPEMFVRGFCRMNCDSVTIAIASRVPGFALPLRRRRRKAGSFFPGHPPLKFAAGFLKETSYFLSFSLRCSARATIKRLVGSARATLLVAPALPISAVGSARAT
jgi:hypothetical protein